MGGQATSHQDLCVRITASSRSMPPAKRKPRPHSLYSKRIAHAKRLNKPVSPPSGDDDLEGIDDDAAALDDDDEPGDVDVLSLEADGLALSTAFEASEAAKLLPTSRRVGSLEAKVHHTSCASAHATRPCPCPHPLTAVIPRRGYLMRRVFAC